MQRLLLSIYMKTEYSVKKRYPTILLVLCALCPVYWALALVEMQGRMLTRGTPAETLLGASVLSGVCVVSIIFVRTRWLKAEHGRAIGASEGRPKGPSTL